jgi:hypothetical protein
MIVDVELLREIADHLDHPGPLSIGTMFRSPGIRAGDKIVAFLGRDNRLIAKLPRDRAVSLIARGAAQEVTMGKRTMREWIAIPAAPDLESTRAKWLPLVQEALVYVTASTEPNQA